ncbi:MAG: hypothetical protein JXR95_15335, partial [Deltaproteobacteria bacterium]|nr:hypothetical protein [Deltaproteobacteria bacterium]
SSNIPSLFVSMPLDILTPPSLQFSPAISSLNSTSDAVGEMPSFPSLKHEEKRHLPAPFPLFFSLGYLQ